MVELEQWDEPLTLFGPDRRGIHPLVPLHLLL